MVNKKIIFLFALPVFLFHANIFSVNNGKEKGAIAAASPVSAMKSSELKKVRYIKGTADQFNFPEGVKVSLLHSGGNWLVFKNVGESKYDLLKEKKKKSKYFNINISDWAVHHEGSPIPKNSFLFLSTMFAFMDIEKKKDAYFIYDSALGFSWTPGQLQSFIRDFSKLTYKKTFAHWPIEEVNDAVVYYLQFYTRNQLREIRKEVIEGMEHTFKIHFQVKPEYIVSFLNDFARLLKSDPRLKNIESFKVAKELKPGYHIPIGKNTFKVHPLPIIVAYLKLIPGSNEDKNKIIEPILDALIERYKDVSEELDLGYPPRFNMEIWDFIWIAGGEGYVKEKYKRALDAHVLDRNNLYTDDFAFFKGYEFDY